MSALLAETAGAGRIEGKGNLALDLITSGGSVGALRKALNGRVSLALARGSLAGIDLRAALLDGRSELGTSKPALIRDARFTDRIVFSELKTTFNFKDGESHGNSFEMRSPMIRTAGEGDFALGSGNIDYRLDARISSSITRHTAGDLAELKGITVPIRVYGFYARPSIALDFGSASGGNVAQLKAGIAAKAATAAQSGSSKTKTRKTKPMIKH